MAETRPRHPATDVAALEAALRRVCTADVGVAWAYLFGSAAGGEGFRDLDVAIMPAEDGRRSALWLGRLAAELQAAVGDVPVDVVDLAAAAVPLQAAALRPGRVLVDRGQAGRLSWELEVVRRWLDLEPWLARFELLRLAALQRGSR
jgi:predicted nucleotidyltransferase